jgi:hypothetical protein
MIYLDKNMEQIISDKVNPIIQTTLENVDELAEALSHHTPGYSVGFLKHHILSKLSIELIKYEVGGEYER